MKISRNNKMKHLPILSGNPTAGNQMYPKKDKTNLRIDYGFLLVVISNEVLIVGIADSVCSSSDISSRELNA